jgi:hypothetical protein
MRRRCTSWFTKGFLLLCTVSPVDNRESGVPGSGEAEPCAAVDCKDSSRCWDEVEHYTAWGRDLASAGNVGAAMNCFTRAANAVQDERWLGRPHALPQHERQTLYRLYVAAAHTLLSLGATADEGKWQADDVAMKNAQAWLLRATQITSPSVEVLFQDQKPPPPPPHTPPAPPPPPSTGAAEERKRAEERDDSVTEDCQLAAAAAAAREGGGARAWELADRCLARQTLRAFAALEKGGGSRGGATEARNGDASWEEVGALHMRVGAMLFAAGRASEGLRCMRMSLRLMLEGEFGGGRTSEPYEICNRLRISYLVTNFVKE